jgi:hypothetical protein
MKTAQIKLTGMSEIAFGRNHGTDKLEKESNDAYELRTWKEKCHFNDKGNVIITAFAIKNMLSESAKFLGIQIPGKGKSTYTKHFEAGIIILEPIVLNASRDEGIVPIKLFVPSDGIRGSSKRVFKYFPTVPNWEGLATITIIDETITKDVLVKHVQQAGQFIGLGSLRPRNNGVLGRFHAEVVSFE